MNNLQITEMMRHRPFQPFEIRVSDGRVYPVDHPEFLAQSRNGHFVVYTTDDDRVIIIDLAHVTSLEVINARAG